MLAFDTERADMCPRDRTHSPTNPMPQSKPERLYQRHILLSVAIHSPPKFHHETVTKESPVSKVQCTTDLLLSCGNFVEITPKSEKGNAKPSGVHCYSSLWQDSSGRYNTKEKKKTVLTHSSTIPSQYINQSHP